MLNFLRTLDRRWIFLLMGLAVAVPLLLRFLPPNSATLMDRSVFEAIEDLPDGSRILVSFDFDPGSQGELLPMLSSPGARASSSRQAWVLWARWRGRGCRGAVQPQC